MAIIKNGSRDLVKSKESTSIYGSASFKSEERNILKNNEYNTEINKSFVNRTTGEQSLNKIINNKAIYKGNNESSNRNQRNNGYRDTINRKELSKERVNIQSYKSYQYTKAKIRKEERLNNKYNATENIKENNKSNNYQSRQDNRNIINRRESNRKYNEGNIRNNYKSRNNENIIKNNNKSKIYNRSNTSRAESRIKYNEGNIRNNNESQNYNRNNTSKTESIIKYKENNIINSDKLRESNLIKGNRTEFIIKSKEINIRDSRELRQSNIIKDNGIKSIIKPEKITLINNKRIKSIIKSKDFNIKNNNELIIKRNNKLDGIIKVKEPQISEKIINKDISEKIINKDISEKIIKKKIPNIKNYDIYGNKKRRLNIVRNNKLSPKGRYKKLIEDLKYIKSVNFSKIKKEFFKGKYIRSVLSNGIDNLNIADNDYGNTIAKEKMYRIAAVPRDVIRAGRSLKRAYNGAKYIKDISKNIKSISNLKAIKLKRIAGKGITTSLINEVNSLKGNENIGIQSIVKTKDAIVTTKNTISITKNTLRYSAKATKKVGKLTRNTFEYSRKGVKHLKKATKLTYNVGRKLSVMATKFITNPIVLKVMAAVGLTIVALSLVVSIVAGVVSIFVGEESNIEYAIPNEDQREFILKLVPIAQDNYEEFGIFPSVTIAQAIHESSWGKSELSIKANNLFGVKADSSWSGQTIDMLTQEHINGSNITVMAKWRKYASLDDSVRDHGKFLKENSRYEVAGVFKAKDYKEQAYAIRMAGYATDPQYASLICNIIESYSLDIYDFKTGEGNKVIERAITTGMSIVGKSPYVFGGGRNPEDIAALKFDCSSFVHWCYANGGLNLGDYRSVVTFGLVNMGQEIAPEDMKRGDLIFFDTEGVANNHVAIYLGDNKFLHDAETHGVWINSLDEGYWKNAFNGNVRRVIE